MRALLNEIIRYADQQFGQLDNTILELTADYSKMIKEATLMVIRQNYKLRSGK